LPKESQTFPQSLIAPAPPLPSSPAQTDIAPDATILDTVTKLGGTLGRTGLAQFLSGSRAGWLEAFFEHSAYGQLSHLSQKAIINIIDALITDDKLTTTGGHRPKVVLPEQHPQHAQTVPTTAVAPQAKMPTEITEARQLEPEEVSPNQESRPDIPQTAPSPDPTLLETLRTWRTEQARVQHVPPYIIFPNKVLEAIAAQHPTTLEKLGKISGMGPAKLEQYGETIITIITAETQAQDHDRESSTSSSTSAQLQVKEDPQEQAESPNHKPETQNPTEAIIAVVSDLDGLLTFETLAQLLIAGPEEIVSFSDHELFSAFYGKLSFDEVTVHIEEALQSGLLSFSPHQRLTLP